MHPLVRRARSIRKHLRERRELAPARVAIVSFPKSGRTWLRMLIGKALCDRHGLPERRILDTFALTSAAGLLPAVFTHDGASNVEGRHLRRLDPHKRAFRRKKVLLLTRDPRDTVVSCFYEATRRKRLFPGSLSEFVRDPHYGIEKVVRFHELWWAARDVPDEFAAISYEELHADPGKRLREALAFLGASDVDEGIVTDAVEFSRFENMRRMELAGGVSRDTRLRPADVGDPDSYKTRRGKVGGYADALSQADLRFANRVIAERDSPLLAAYRS
jgi:hypothetical protein